MGIEHTLLPLGSIGNELLTQFKSANVGSEKLAASTMIMVHNASRTIMVLILVFLNRERPETSTVNNMAAGTNAYLTLVLNIHGG